MFRTGIFASIHHKLEAEVFLIIRLFGRYVLLIDDELLKFLTVVKLSSSGPSIKRRALRLCNPKDKDNKIFRNVRNISHIDTPLHPKRLEYSTTNVSSTAVRNSNFLQVTFTITDNIQVRES